MKNKQLGVKISERLYWQIKLMALDQGISFASILVKVLRHYVWENISNLSDNYSGHWCFDMTDEDQEIELEYQKEREEKRNLPRKNSNLRM